MLNDYDEISKQYNLTHDKPDKKYSMLPTILELLRPLKDKVILDVGCGDGYFSFPISKEAKFVYGIDNSSEQIKKAREKITSNTEFFLEDIFKFNKVKVDKINAPFVINYCKSKSELLILFQRLRELLNNNGELIGLVDMPKTCFSDLMKFGSIKKVMPSLIDGATIEIDLYNSDKKIISLNSFYYTKKTIEEALIKAGFSKVCFQKPIISEEGYKLYSEEFWKEYLEKCDVEYFIAYKR